MQIPVNKAVRPGKKVRLKMKISEDKEIQAEGRIVWKRPIDKNLVHEENAGVEFVRMNDDSRDALSGYIQTLTNGA